MDSNQKFWLTFWLLGTIVACIALCVPIRAAIQNDVEMAKVGYVEKVIIVGDPSNQYTRYVMKVWVKIGDTPTVEMK